MLHNHATLRNGVAQCWFTEHSQCFYGQAVIPNLTAQVATQDMLVGTCLSF
jgi:hypothetical protein